MEKQTLIEALRTFERAYDELMMTFHDYGSDLPEGIFEDYPFEKSFDEYSIGIWVETAVRKLKQEQAKDRQKIYLKIIKMLEDRYWEYDVINDHIEVEIGNELYKVSKYDFADLEELYLEIKNW